MTSQRRTFWLFFSFVLVLTNPLDCEAQTTAADSRSRSGGAQISIDSTRTGTGAASRSAIENRSAPATLRNDVANPSGIRNDGANGSGVSNESNSLPSNGDEFQIPTNVSPERLLDWATQLTTRQRSFASKEEYDRWLDQMLQTVLTAAEKVISSETDDATYLKGCNLKGRILCYQWRLHPTAFPILKQFVDSLANDRRVLGQPGGELIVSSFQATILQGRLTNLVRDNGDVRELEKIVQEISALVLKRPEMAGAIEDCVYPVTVYAETNRRPTLVADVFSEIYETFRQSDDENIRRAAASLEGTIRWTRLEGNSMTIEGTFCDGRAFDPGVLKEKTVVFYFWATWCVPCHIMNRDLLKIYEEYNDRGLAVVGYSVDENQEELESYLDYEKFPWAILSKKSSVQNNLRPLDEYYGVGNIPTLVLIGADGKVLKTDLDVEQLKVELEKIFPTSSADAPVSSDDSKS